MALLLWGATTFASVPPRTGWWKFDDPLDMLAATTGQALVLTGTQTSVAGPVDGNLATELSVGSYLTMTHGIAANGGGTKVNEYTLQLDILMPTGGMYHAIYQTAADNSNDAEMFINPDNFIGAWRFGYSANSVSENSWYRLIVTVKNGQFFKIYMNGELWVDGAGMDVDDRDALEATLLLFADEDGEDNTMLCSEAGIWDVAHRRRGARTWRCQHQHRYPRPKRPQGRIVGTKQSQSGIRNHQLPLHPARKRRCAFCFDRPDRKSDFGRENRLSFSRYLHT